MQSQSPETTNLQKRRPKEIRKRISGQTHLCQDRRRKYQGRCALGVLRRHLHAPKPTNSRHPPGQTSLRTRRQKTIPSGASRDQRLCYPTYSRCRPRRYHKLRPRFCRGALRPSAATSERCNLLQRQWSREHSAYSHHEALQCNINRKNTQEHYAHPRKCIPNCPDKEGRRSETNRHRGSAEATAGEMRLQKRHQATIIHTGASPAKGRLSQRCRSCGPRGKSFCRKPREDDVLVKLDFSNALTLCEGTA